MFIVWGVFRQNEDGLFPEPDLRVETSNENSRVLGPGFPKGGGGSESILIRKKVIDLDCTIDGAVPCDQEVARKSSVSVPHLTMKPEVAVERSVQLLERAIGCRGSETERGDDLGPEIVRTGKNVEASGKPCAASKANPVKKAENKAQDFCENISVRNNGGADGAHHSGAR